MRTHIAWAALAAGIIFPAVFYYRARAMAAKARTRETRFRRRRQQQRRRDGPPLPLAFTQTHERGRNTQQSAESDVFTLLTDFNGQEARNGWSPGAFSPFFP